MKNTILVNLFAAPGSGKSTMTAGIFEKLKWQGVDCEMALEFAKDLVWECRDETFKDQNYIFAKQLHRIFRLNGKVDVVITDSPLLFSIFYDEINGKLLPISFRKYALDCHCMFNNLNYFIEREKPYNPNGRNQSEEESIKIANYLMYKLQCDWGVLYKHHKGNKDSVDFIVKDILNKLNA